MTYLRRCPAELNQVPINLSANVHLKLRPFRNADSSEPRFGDQRRDSHEIVQELYHDANAYDTMEPRQKRRVNFGEGANGFQFKLYRSVGDRLFDLILFAKCAGPFILLVLVHIFCLK
jgi:hypothetical protein